MLLVNQFHPQEDLPLFNTPVFFRMHATSRAYYFQWFHGGRVLASIHFTELEPGFFRSPSRGSYAGLACQPNARLEILASFLNAVHDYLRELGARRLELVFPPAQYDSAQYSRQYYLLRTLGFIETHLDLNFGMVITEQSFNERISDDNQRRFRKCQREGMQARQLPSGDLRPVYALLEKHHCLKGYPLSMSEEQVQTMIDSFPGRVALFICELDSKLVAAAICVQVLDKVRYIYCIGDLPGFSTFSPAVMLVEAIYRSCQAEGVELLDYGVSTLGMEPNYGLINFKRGLGFCESLKARVGKKFDA